MFIIMLIKIITIIMTIIIIKATAIMIIIIIIIIIIIVIFIISYFHLKSKRVISDHLNNYQKYLSGAVLKNICLEDFPQVIIKASVAEFHFH